VRAGVRGAGAKRRRVRVLKVSRRGRGSCLPRRTRAEKKKGLGRGGDRAPRSGVRRLIPPKEEKGREPHEPAASKNQKSEQKGRSAETGGDPREE